MGFLDEFFERGRAGGRRAKGESQESAVKTPPRAPEPARPPTKNASQTQQGSAPEPRAYTVQPGDTLSKIAERHYGDASAYRKIFDANRGLLNDPDKIYPGQVLRIP